VSTILIIIELICLAGAGIALLIFHTIYHSSRSGSVPMPPRISIKCHGFKGTALPSESNRILPNRVLSRKEGNLEQLVKTSEREDFLFYNLDTVEIWQRVKVLPENFEVTYQLLPHLKDNGYYKYGRDDVQVYWSANETVEKCYLQQTFDFSKTFYHNKRWSVPILSATSLAFALMIISILIK